MEHEIAEFKYKIFNNNLNLTLTLKAKLYKTMYEFSVIIGDTSSDLNVYGVLGISLRHCFKILEVIGLRLHYIDILLGVMIVVLHLPPTHTCICMIYCVFTWKTYVAFIYIEFL